MPPARTGVADYARTLLDALSAHCDVRVGNADADVSLYHLGNNGLHRDIYRAALEKAGVAVLHDAVLNHFFLGTLDRDAYIEEFAYNYGEFSRGLATELWERRSRSGAEPSYFERPMVRRITETSRAVVVHNPKAARIVRDHAPAARIIEIPHLFERQELPARDAVASWRAAHGIAPSDFLFGVFGYLARKFQYEMAPLVLALVIGPMMENNLRLSLVISQGDPWIFIEHPISAVFIFISLALLLSPFLPWLGKRRQKLQEKVQGEEV
jgi:hypothetical protein